MKRTLFAVVVAAASLAGADLSGSWTGTLEMRNHPVPQRDSHVVTLQQNGNSVTGTAGPDAQTQWPIRKSSVEGQKVRFTVQTPGESPMIIEYKLELKGDELAGVVDATNREGVSWNLRLKRAR